MQINLWVCVFRIWPELTHMFSDVKNINISTHQQRATPALFSAATQNLIDLCWLEAAAVSQLPVTSECVYSEPRESFSRATDGTAARHPKGFRRREMQPGRVGESIEREWEDVSGGMKLRLCLEHFLDGWMTKRKERQADVAEWFWIRNGARRNAALAAAIVGRKGERWRMKL